MVRTIGIIGGVGPAAGIALHQQILSQTPSAQRDQDHLEVILHTNTRIPDRSAFLLGRSKENPSTELKRSARILIEAGARLLAIPCVTAHAEAIFEPMQDFVRQSRSDVRLLSIVDETCHALQDFPAGPIGLLATEGTVRGRVFDAPVAAMARELLIPDAAGQERVMDAIYNERHGIKAVSEDRRGKARQMLTHEAEKLIRGGAAAVVLGCTEIPLAMDEAAIEGRPLVNPLEVLASALVRAASEGQ